MPEPLLNVSIGSWALAPEHSAVLDVAITSCCGLLATMETCGLSNTPICCVGDRAALLVRCDYDKSMSLGRTPTGYEIIYWRSLSEFLEAREGFDHVGAWLVEPVHKLTVLPAAARVLAALWTASLAALRGKDRTSRLPTLDLDALLRGPASNCPTTWADNVPAGMALPGHQNVPPVFPLTVPMPVEPGVVLS